MRAFLCGADQDRRERRLRLGLPEELTEEEKEEERRKEREKAEVEARRKLPVKPVAGEAFGGQGNTHTGIQCMAGHALPVELL